MVDAMRIIDDWLEDWISERKNILADDVLSLAGRARSDALADGYRVHELSEAANGDLDRYMTRALISRLIFEAPIAAFELQVIKV